jgi:hypothetical protein
MELAALNRSVFLDGLGSAKNRLSDGPFPAVAADRVSGKEVRQPYSLPVVTQAVGVVRSRDFGSVNHQGLFFPWSRKVGFR